MEIKTRSSKLSLIALASAALLFGCSDGNDGEDGKDGEVGFSIAQANELKASISSASVTEGVVAVEFSLENANGVAITDLDTYQAVDWIGMGVAKLLPTEGKGYKTPQWVNYINSAVEPVATDVPPGYEDKASTQFQPGLESSCAQECIENLSSGMYRYTFQLNLNEVPELEGLDLTFDDSLTHRITMELRADGTANKLINAHYDFLPSSGEMVAADATRTVEFLEQSCLRCHSDDYDHAWAPKLLFHGGRRFDIANCQMCHTSYAGDPETGAPIDMGYMVHKIHKSDYLMVGYGGSIHDYSEVTFPADMYDCRACHQEGDTSPVDAFNFKHHRALACGSCHSDSTDPEQIKTDMHDRYIETTDCSTCHAEKGEPGAAHHFTDAVAKDNAKDSYSASLVPASVSITGGMITFDVQFADSSLTTPVMSPDTDKRITLSAIYFGFGNDIDFGSGTQKVDLIALAPTAVSDGIYRYTTSTSITADTSQAATAVVSTKMCVDRDTLMGVACGTGTDESNNPAVITGDLVAFNLSGDDSVMARRVVVSNDTCANCHDEKFIGKFGIDFKHGGSYSNFEGECQMCHNPTRSGADSKSIQDHIDFKVRIHAHHANKRSTQDPITFPENYGNCAVCHDKGQLKMDGLGAMVATPSTDAVLGMVEFSPIASTCVSCHGATDSLISHIRSNGGAANDPRGTYVPGSESCATCHAEGKTNGVDSVHPVEW